MFGKALPRTSSLLCYAGVMSESPVVPIEYELLDFRREVDWRECKSDHERAVAEDLALHGLIVLSHKPQFVSPTMACYGVGDGGSGLGSRTKLEDFEAPGDPPNDK